MSTCVILSPTRIAFLVSAVALLIVTPGASDHASQQAVSDSINVDEYFQIPADLFLHQHSLARHSQHIQSSQQLAHRIKTGNGWKTSSDAQLATIDQQIVFDSFFYHNSQTGAVSNITAAFETVSDTIYFDQILSAQSVSCDGDLISVKFDPSILNSPPNDSLTFGTKCAHYASNIRVTGGNAFFCSTPSDSTALFFRRITSVISCVEDPDAGRTASIKLITADSNPLSFYNSISDYNLNGSMALIP
jgi:hypothetical protein